LQNSPIRVGPIDLQEFEVPQSLRFGGRHRVVIHTLAGGQRVIERLGPDDNEIRFRGTFSGAFAEARARAFDNLRLSGEIVWLTWESFRRQIIVTSFLADYHNRWWIPYQISCVVVDQMQTGSRGMPGLAVAVATDLGAALSAAVGSSIALAALQVGVSAGNALTANTFDRSIAIVAAGAVLENVNNQMSQQSASLVAPIAAGAPSGIFGQMYASKVNCAASLAAATNVRSYVGRIGVNIGRSQG
jgi:hypothetical protein